MRLLDLIPMQQSGGRHMHTRQVPHWTAAWRCGRLFAALFLTATAASRLTVGPKQVCIQLAGGVLQLQPQRVHPALLARGVWGGRGDEGGMGYALGVRLAAWGLLLVQAAAGTAAAAAAESPPAHMPLRAHLAGRMCRLGGT